jgi:hypothetical protein
VRLLSAIAISIAVSATVAAGVMRYVASHTVAPAFWQHDPDALLWLAVGGPAVIGLIAFMASAFLFVTGGILRDIAIARVRLEGDGAEVASGQPDWGAVFDGTAFAPIADQLAVEEFRAAPLSLLRVVRIEAWRVYGKRVVGIEILALAGGAALALIAPAWLAPPSAAAGAGWEVSAALLLLTAVAGAWLLVDQAIGRMSGAIIRSAATWPPSVVASASPAAGPDPSLGRIGPLLGTLERLIAALSTQADPSEGVAKELALARAELRPLLERIDERLAASPTPEGAQDGPVASRALAGLTEALSDVARAMESLSSAGSAAGRWDELEATMRAMGASLDAITAALQAQPPRPAGPRTVTDRLEELLEEISSRS